MSVSLAERIANLEAAVGTSIDGTVQLATADGVLNPVPGEVVVTKASVCALTLAAPISGDSTSRLRVVSGTGYAHTITTSSNVINGNSSVVTFGGAIGDAVELRAHGQQWLVVGGANIELS